MDPLRAWVLSTAVRAAVLEDDQSLNRGERRSKISNRSIFLSRSLARCRLTLLRSTSSSNRGHSTPPPGCEYMRGRNPCTSVRITSNNLCSVWSSDWITKMITSFGWSVKKSTMLKHTRTGLRVPDKQDELHSCIPSTPQSQDSNMSPRYPLSNASCGGNSRVDQHANPCTGIDVCT